MKELKDCKSQIHSCSKCGLCQSVCPIYKETGNDCTVSRGHFIMLKELINGKLKMSKTINRYLDLCLKCSACSNFCPSGINIVEIISLAKAEYFKKHRAEKLYSFIQKFILLNIGLNFLNLFSSKNKSKTFEKKVVYFGGCSSKLEGNSHVVKLLNSLNVEVITPNFDCCGLPFYLRGDMNSFYEYMQKFYKIYDKYKDYEIVTTCASCEKALKMFAEQNKEKNLNIKNIFEYLKENNLSFELKGKCKKVTFHKPCNLNNYEDIKWLLENTKNLEYIEMKDYDKCCGLSGISNFKERKIMQNIFRNKYDNIKSTNANTVLTSCFGCQVALRLNSRFQYKVEDLTKFIARNIK